MATLIITEGPATGQKFGLERHRLLMLGRDASCTIQIVDPELSRQHMQIEFAENEKRHYAIDVGSKNGVFVNGVKVDKRIALKDCDIIRIGETTLVYAVDDASSAAHVRDAAKRFGQGHVHTLGLDAPGQSARQNP